MTTTDPSSIAADRWPGVVSAPSAPLRAWVVRQLARRAAARVRATIRLPDGSTFGTPRAGQPELDIRSWRFFDRLGAHTRIGFGESYMAGEWGPAPGTDLGDLLTAFALDLDQLVPPALARFRRLVELRHPADEHNTRDGARRNIARHYDLSNELFASFLDETMTYSAAWFDGATDAPFEELAPAQRRKIDRLLDVAGVREHTHLLEIGTGWGQLAIQAAQRGARVHSVTLSREQQLLAQQRIAAAGVADRVLVEVRDYRELDGTYDAAVSVEMVEAVGERFLSDYFDVVYRALAPGARFGLQAITVPNRRMLATRDTYGWIQKYVFPGGFVPSRELLERQARANGFAVLDRHSLRWDYARTLQLWRQRFVEAAGGVEALGFDHVFRRLWEFYLAYSEAGFRSGQLDDWQLTLRAAC